MLWKMGQTALTHLQNIHDIIHSKTLIVNRFPWLLMAFSLQLFPYISCKSSSIS